MKTFSVLLALAVTLSLAHAEGAAEQDPRLLHRVTISAASIPLHQLAEDLSRQTGVEIRAGASEADWRVRERRVHVLLQDLPLGAALRGIAGGTGYRLRRTGNDGEWAYQIWQPAADRDAEETLRRGRRAEEERGTQARLESAFESAEAAAENPDEALHRKEEDPWKAYLGGTEGGRAYAQLLRSLSPDARDRIRQGRKAMVELSEFPPEVRRQLQGLIPQNVRERIVESMGPEGDVFRQLVPTRVVFQPLSEEADGEQERAAGALGTIAVLGEPEESSEAFERMVAGNPLSRLGGGMPMAMLPLTSGDTPLGRTFGKAMLRMEAGENPRDVFAAMQGEMDGLGNGSGTEDGPEDSDATPSDPRLLKEIEPLEVRPDEAGEPVTARILRLLKGKTTLSFVLEHYPNERERRITLPGEKAPLYRILDAMKAAGYGWELNGDGVRIRPEDWAMQRSYDVPESTLERYRRFLRAGGVPDLDVLAEVAAALTDGQIRHRFLRDPVLKAFSPGLTSNVSGSRALLRFYAALSPALKARMKRPEGLAFADLSPEEIRRLAGFLDDETGGRAGREGVIAVKIVSDPPAPGPSEGKEEAEKSGDGPAQTPEAGGGRAVFTLTLPAGEGRKPLILERAVEMPGAAAIRRLRAAETAAE